MPQGSLADDAYTERFDTIISGVRNKTKCVDDSLLWSDSVESNFFDVCKFLTLCSANGIVMNPKKFIFCSKEVEFAYSLLETGQSGLLTRQLRQ